MANDSGHPGTPDGYSNSNQSLEKKFKSDGQNALEAMKRRMSGPYGDDSGNSETAEQKRKKLGSAEYPGSP